MHSRDAETGRLGIWGFGVEGRAALAALAPSFASVMVFDEHDATSEVYPREGVEFYCGSGHIHHLLNCDLVVVSPGVASMHPFLTELKNKGVELVSGSAFWLESNAQRTIGVTGTKGKSTTAALIHHILSNASINSVLAGNIGIPLIGVTQDERLVVAELSSYQCWWITRSPRVSVVTNLFEEHLPWHGGLQQYWQAKARIVTRGAEFFICDSATWEKLKSVDKAVNETSVLLIQDSGSEILAKDDTPVLSVDDLPAGLKASHLVSSIRAAVLAASIYLDATRLSSTLKAALREFNQLPHRLEVVGSLRGVNWVDDSLSTTPQSVIAAMQSFQPGRIVLIVGGQDRGISYEPLNEFLKSTPEPVDVITIPTNGPRAVANFREDRPSRVHDAKTLRDAVFLASKIAPTGSHVILSPGAPSYDCYENYKSKSAEFREAIKRLGDVP